MRVFLMAGMTAGILLSTLSSPALAAPQILAALPNGVGVPFTCAEGQCQADLSTYCLQQKRPAPSHGTVYTPAAAGDFALDIRTPKGTRTVAAADHVRFVESRGFMAVTAVIAQGELKKLGGLDAVIRVGKAASLLPEPVPYDPNPLTEKEIAYVTKWRREQGAEMVDKMPKAKAAQVLASIAGRMPQSGTVAPHTLNQIWEQAIGDEMQGVPATQAVPGLQRARMEFKTCQEGPARYSFGGIRRCLEYRHDDIIRDLNIDYWKSSPGS
ncbi:MAG: hypothetical protein HOB37_03660 [Rhodospirillaceae bacterium]|nr:hypothetical protein [Rhodospirillaceae bacterium]MBT6607547.1 hypothetical protein [Rhodospirillaceae bacterium]